MEGATRALAQQQPTHQKLAPAGARSFRAGAGCPDAGRCSERQRTPPRPPHRACPFPRFLNIAGPACRLVHSQRRATSPRARRPPWPRRARSCRSSAPLWTLRSRRASLRFSTPSRFRAPRSAPCSVSPRRHHARTQACFCHCLHLRSGSGPPPNLPTAASAHGRSPLPPSRLQRWRSTWVRTPCAPSLWRPPRVSCVARRCRLPAHTLLCPCAIFGCALGVRCAPTPGLHHICALVSGARPTAAVLPVGCWGFILLRRSSGSCHGCHRSTTRAARLWCRWAATRWAAL